MRNILLLMWFFFTASFAIWHCTKPQPNIYGTWTNVQGIGIGAAKYNYRIEKDGELCAFNVDLFGGTKFCAAYEHDAQSNTTRVNFQEGQTWNWQFYNENTALVKITTDAGQMAEIVLTK